MKKQLLIILSLLLTLTACEKPVGVSLTISLSPEAIQLKVGEKYQLTATCTPEGLDPRIVFKSQNPQVASVSSQGVVTALSTGEAIITAQLGDQVATSTVTVRNDSETALIVETTELTLKKGETRQIVYRVSPQDTPVTFTSDNPSVAKVDELGVVSGIDVGSCQISIQAADTVVRVPVSVVAEDIPQELPLLKFDPVKENWVIVDKEILGYEKNLGRTPQDINWDHEIPMPGFVNTELKTITAVIYGMTSEDPLGDVIAAYSKETLQDCSNTRKMLSQLGFKKLNKEELTFGGKTFPVLRGTHESNPQLTVFLMDDAYPELQATMYIEFALAAPEAPMGAEHEIIPDAVDFPSVEAFRKKDVTSIKAFETALGLRHYAQEYSSDTSLDFETLEDKVSKTNIRWVNYICEAPNGVPFINMQLLCISGEEDLKSEAFKSYLKANGFGLNYTYTDGVVNAYNAHGDFLGASIKSYEDGTFCQIQIRLKEDKKKASPRLLWLQNRRHHNKRVR